MNLTSSLLALALLPLVVVAAATNSEGTNNDIAKLEVEVDESIVSTIDVLNNDDGESPVTLPVLCPSDYLVVKRNGKSPVEEEVATQRHVRQLRTETTTTTPTVAVVQPIQIIQQGGSYVEFTIQNTTWFHDSNSNSQSQEDSNLEESEKERRLIGGSLRLPDHIFTTLETGTFGSRKCIMEEGLDASSSPSTDIMKAHCFPRTNNNKLIGSSSSSSSSMIAMIRTHARYLRTATTSAIETNGIEIPDCCQDPYATNIAESSSSSSVSIQSQYYVIEHIYEVMCSPSPSCVTDKPEAEEEEAET